MVITFLLLLSSVLAALILLYPEITLTILKAEFVIYLLMIACNLYTTRRLTLFSTWIVAYIFIIWSDMMLCAYSYSATLYTIPIIFYLLGNNCLLLGYHMTTPKKKKMIIYSYNIKHPRYMIIFILGLIAFYCVLQVENIIITLAYGRVLSDVKGGGSLVGSLVGGIGLVTPSVIAYYIIHYQKRSIIYSLIFALPIFIIEFILGTRFRILFQILPFLLVSGVMKLSNLKLRNLVTIFICAIIFSIGSSFIKENRNTGYVSYSSSASKYSSNEYGDTFVNLASNMSPEGIIHMAHLANMYFENHNLTYGKEISFILYFWIPRSIWKDKPVPIDHWLIRKYENVPDKHSSASGFLGELRADFGWFSLFFAFIIGMIIKHCDNYVNNLFSLKNRPYQIILAATLYPYFFFFVRSPLTATISLSFALIIYYIIKTCFCKKIKYSYETASNKLNC